MFKGQIAQLVEQRTENPCVVGSIPSLSTPFDGIFPYVGKVTTFMSTPFFLQFTLPSSYMSRPVSLHASVFEYHSFPA